MSNESDSSILRFFARKSSEADRLREEIQQLRRVVDELTILSDVAFAIGGQKEPQEIVETLVDRLMRAVNAEQAVVLADPNPKDAGADLMKTNLRLRATSGERSALRPDDTLLGFMHVHKKPAIINDPQSDTRFRSVSWNPTIRSIMCVPLMVKSQMIGILTIYNKKDAGGFTENDQRLLTMIAAQSAPLIENARLRQESLVLEQVRQEQKNAYEIQRNLLPRAAPVIEGYDVAGASTPAQTVGGDYFDFIPGTDGRWAICLGDVSGKGLPASLLMANLQATLRAQTLSNVSPEECVRRSNQLLYRNMDAENFVTLFYSELDYDANRLSYCNAGHEHPLLFSSEGAMSRLESTGIALGVLESFSYTSNAVDLRPGDTLVIYSDGITDATNRVQEPFGLDRLIKVASEYLREPASEIIRAVMDAVREHAADAPQFDDLTLVVLKRSES